MPRLALALAISMATISFSCAATVTVLYDESTNPVALSTNNMAPTDLGVLASGLNRVTGNLESALSVGNVDVFKFDVPTGFQLDGVFVFDYGYPNTPPVGEGAAFLAINDAAIFPYDAFDLDFNTNPFLDETQFLGGSTFGSSDAPTLDILPRIGNVAGRKFTGPLAAGTYTVYIQQTGPENFYSLDFQSTSLTAVPEPAHASLAILAMATIAVKRRRTKRCLTN
ncbi:hypothetical protein [Rubripirellula reticaptiva]|uniref:PEP-CTERM protein-sorting domain-containing protein n=1 Tax=Rubripirellula reticaptiva TaxID=2528013 RepID=A0A5C6ESB8_9BACT|nr:hypothetical protein [Rubripirellula reticaptiva]TWU51210.1 hypothetical protein Poly59_28010 [Rubripirellula reticaptiva]